MRGGVRKSSYYILVFLLISSLLQHTGTPKGAMLTHGNVNSAASAIQVTYEVCISVHKTFTHHEYFHVSTVSSKMFLLIARHFSNKMV